MVCYTADTGTVINTSVTDIVINTAVTDTVINTAVTDTVINTAVTDTVINTAVTDTVINTRAQAGFCKRYCTLATYTVNTLRIINAGQDNENTCHLIKMLN